MSNSSFQRRRFLQGGCSLGAGALLAATGCASGPLRTTPNSALVSLPYAREPGRVALGWFASPDMRGLCDRLVPEVDDLRWLSRRDSVFIKVACNSMNPHPAVTDPQAVSEVVRFLKSRGAGRIFVGDQAGVEHVRLTHAQRVSSTRAMMARNGLRDAIVGAGAIFHAFDDQGWDGYFRAEPDFASVWKHDLWLPKVLEEVDHVVYLPRLGAHALAGYTCGLKNAVGWLRDDSRRVLHQKGAAFYERIAEINHFRPLRDKLRLTLTLGHAALTSIGPDFGGVHRFDGCMALAARSLVDHDYAASVVLEWLHRETSSVYDLYSPFPNDADYWNRGLVGNTWGDTALEGYEPLSAFRIGGGIETDPCLSHLAGLQQYRPKHIVLQRMGDGFPSGLEEHLAGAAGGLLRV